MARILVFLSLLFAANPIFAQSKSGLLIENKINRGVNYTHPDGTDYSIRYIPVNFANDTTIPVHIQIKFAKQYDYPKDQQDKHFRLVPLPKPWATDGNGVTQEMLDEVAGIMANPTFEQTLQPGEQLLIAIASVYPRPARSTGVLPRILFAPIDGTTEPECDWNAEAIPTSESQSPLQLKMMFGARCRVINCGTISY